MFNHDGRRYFAVVTKAPEDEKRFRVWFPDLPGCETRTESRDSPVVKEAADQIVKAWIAQQMNTEDPIPIPGYPTLTPWPRLLRKTDCQIIQ